MDWFLYENQCAEQGYSSICGVDEAGRGPLAGPVCAAAVILKPNDIIEGVNDSKKLSEKKREALYDVIKDRAAAYSIAFASVEEIEELNILNATMLAMKRAVEAKVTRDRLMLEYDKEYPQYMFAKHKGYGTKVHTQAIREYGPCPIHRMSFLKKILSK